MKIALVTYEKQAKFAQGVTNDEDDDLIAFLKAKGEQVVSTIWNDNKVDWEKFDVAILKSPWDYHNHLDEFLAWVDRICALGVKLLNPTEIIKWNSHKKYLADFAKQGLPTIPAEYLSKGGRFEEELFDRLGDDRLVVKPCVSAGAQHTISVHRRNYADLKLEIDQGLQNEDYIVQPFIEEINGGEWSFLFFNGTYSHCALKTPKQGDFRVQHYHGGSISYPTPSLRHIQQASVYMSHLSQPTLYARVDGVVINDTFVLMELELIEPYLFFNQDLKLFENYYQALIALTS